MGNIQECLLMTGPLPLISRQLVHISGTRVGLSLTRKWECKTRNGNIRFSCIFSWKKIDCACFSLVLLILEIIVRELLSLIQLSGLRWQGSKSISSGPLGLLPAERHKCVATASLLTAQPLQWHAVLTTLDLFIWKEAVWTGMSPSTHTLHTEVSDSVATTYSFIIILVPLEYGQKQLAIMIYRRAETVCLWKLKNRNLHSICILKGNQIQKRTLKSYLVYSISDASFQMWASTGV